MRGAARYASILFSLIAAYVLVGKVGLSLAVSGSNVTAVWPPAGLAMAALFLFGSNLWPAVWIGALILNLPLTTDPLSSLAIACGNAAESLLGAWFLSRLGGARAFETPRGFLRFICACGLGAAAVAATVGVSSLLLTALVAPEGAGILWLTWWVGDAMSVWLLVPAILLVHEGWTLRREWRWKRFWYRLPESLGLVAALAGAHVLVFGGVLPDPYKNLPIAFLTLPPMLWSSYRFGRTVTALMLVAHSAFAIVGTARGLGPFSLIPNSFLLLQMFLATGLLSFQLLAVVMRARDRALAELRESEARVESILRSAPGIVWESWGNPVGPDHRLTYVSGYAQELLGYSRREWLDRPGLLMDSVHLEDRGRVAREAADTFAGRRSAPSQFRFLAKDGKVVEAELRAALIRDGSGRTVGMRGFTLDITERKRAEERLKSMEDQLNQARKMEAVGRLAGGIAHDFNNLLTAVNGYAGLIEDMPVASSLVREYAGEIRKAGTRAADLTRQLLTFSRKDVYQPRVFDLNGLILSQEELLHALLGEGNRLALSLAPGTLEVKADPDHIAQILVNLARNARDAMPEGGLLAVSTAFHNGPVHGSGFYLEPDPGPHAVMTVADTGSGIAPEVYAHLFEPFFTTKGRTRAMGLGLSTVYGILERAGGGVRVESAPGRGARFEIFLRAHRSEVAAAEAKAR